MNEPPRVAPVEGGALELIAFRLDMLTGQVNTAMTIAAEARDTAARNAVNLERLVNDPRGYEQVKADLAEILESYRWSRRTRRLILSTAAVCGTFVTAIGGVVVLAHEVVPFLARLTRQ